MASTALLAGCVLLAHAAAAGASEPTACSPSHVGVEDLDLHLGSKSPYSCALVHPDRETCHATRETRVGAQCPTSRVLVLARHGTRFPTAKALHKFAKLERALGGNWTSPFRDVDEGLLTPGGKEELRGLGARLAGRFPDVFREYHPRSIHFLSSNKTRALQSASAFARGAFPGESGIAIHSRDEDRDHILRFHDTCPRYAQHKKRVIVPPVDPGLLSGVLSRVSSRLAEKLHHSTLGEKHILNLWSACRFERSSLGVLDGACGFFQKEDAQVLEHMADLEDYWTKGFGHALNYHMACHLVKDVLAAFVAAPEPHLTGKFLFGHAETLMPLVALLGLFQDHAPLRGALQPSRRWRSGVLAPFAGNVVIVVRRRGCGGAAEETVELLHNERALDISHLCGDPCPAHEFARKLNEIAGQCNFQDVCSVE